MQSFLYPHVNVPPITYKVKFEENTHPLEEYVDVMSDEDDRIVTNKQQYTRPAISFVPRVWGESELLAVQGNMYHPERHLYVNNQLVSPVEIREEIIEMPVAPTTKTIKIKDRPSKNDEQTMKYYVAGLSVVGLLIFYRFVTKSKY